MDIEKLIQYLFDNINLCGKKVIKYLIIGYRG